MIEPKLYNGKVHDQICKVGIFYVDQKSQDDHLTTAVLTHDLMGKLVNA